MMRNDLPAAALRLMLAYPVKTHEQRIVRHVQGSQHVPAIIIHGRQYPSVLAAARGLKRSRTFVRRMLTIGKARYV